MTNNLGRVEEVKVRDIWPHEAHDFTQWMLDNADVLSHVLGMQLELTAAEHKVGGFALDLIGKDLASGGTVIVENQLEQTDHRHLGQLMTYAGGTDPATVVWCAPTFRDEHRAALDWLNDRTDEGTRFFGVEIAAVRIDDSRPAPVFRLVAKPNDWAKQVHTEKASALTGKSAAYREFWAELLQKIRAQHPTWTSSNASSQSWITIPYGKSTIWYGFLFTQTGPAVELYFGASDAFANQAEFEKFQNHQIVMEEKFGDPLIFEPLPNKKACRIRCHMDGGGDVLDAGARQRHLEWFLTTMVRFRSATEHVKVLIAAEG